MASIVSQQEQAGTDSGEVTSRAAFRSNGAVDPKLTVPSGLRLHSLTGVQILATGAYAPANEVRNEDLAEHGYDADWIVQRTGIRARRRATRDEATSDMAVAAATRCLEQAQVARDDVDLLIVATMTPDSPAPSTACLVQQRLGLRCAAFDLNAACAGFMYGLATGMQFIKTGASRRALVIGADLMSRTVNPVDSKTFPLFGDGAGAVLLGPGKSEQGLLAYTLGADGGGADLLCIPGGGSREPLTPVSLDAGRQFLRMDGRAVFKWAVRMVADSIVDVLRAAELAPNELDLVVLHQANVRIIESAMSDLGIDREKVLVNLDRYGNTSAGSMPLVLDEAHRAGRIRNGDHILMCGFGAGLAWGAAVMRW
ncbi:MAG: beta-ketoacyl-ACP synthase III [Pirellulaceae bacterium]|nr:ketoacyl-ACP synthase III [Planctomycetales bacterium]